MTLDATRRNYDKNEVMRYVTDWTPLYRRFMKDSKLTRESDGWVKIRCPLPGHNDRNPSFSFRPDNGQWRCWSQCDDHGSPFDFIMKLQGCTFAEAVSYAAELFGLDAARPATRSQTRATLRTYAEAKRLPMDFLQGLGVADGIYSGDKGNSKAMLIPYRNRAGEVVTSRARFKMEKPEGRKDNRFAWPKGAKLLLYGLWRDMPGDSMLLVEGESDCHTLWYHGIAAYGVPGSGNFRAEWAPELADRKTVYIWQEHDEAGARFAAKTARLLRDGGFAGQVKIVSMADFKDVSDLHKADQEHFKERLTAAMTEAREPSAETMQGMATDAGERGSGRFFQWNESGKRTFIPALLEGALTEEFHVVYVSGPGLHVYDPATGTYKADAEPILERRMKEHLGEDFRKSRAEETLYQLGVGRVVGPDEMNKDMQDCITVLNGRVHWPTRTLLDHDPAALTTIGIPVTYDPKAICPLIDQFLHQVVPEDCVDLLYEMLGYCLIPDTKYQKAFMLTGSGSNGKSTFLELAEAFIGSANMANVPLQELDENRFKRANLYGKLVNIFADLDAKALQTSTYFKTIASGDRIDAERKFGAPFDFKPFARLLFSANEIPRSSDRSHAYYRRWIIIPFPNKFEKDQCDPDLLKKLTIPEELSGLLNAALAGLYRLEARRGFAEPGSAQAAMDIYKRANDSVLSFAAECLDAGPHLQEGKSIVYSAYKTYCDESNLRAASSIRFNERLLEIFPQVKEDRNFMQRQWIGIRLKNE